MQKTTHQKLWVWVVAIVTKTKQFKDTSQIKSSNQQKVTNYASNDIEDILSGSKLKMGK